MTAYDGEDMVLHGLAKEATDLTVTWDGGFHEFEVYSEVWALAHEGLRAAVRDARCESEQDSR